MSASTLLQSFADKTHHPSLSHSFLNRFCSCCRCTKRKFVCILVCILLSNILLICILYYLSIQLYADVNGCFRTEKEMEDLRHLVHKFHDIATFFDVPYWIDYGTLLGAVKIGDVLPWDRDVDVSMRIEDLYRLRRLATKTFELYDMDLRTFREVFFPWPSRKPQGDINCWLMEGNQLVSWGSRKKNSGSLRVVVDTFPSHWVQNLTMIKLGGRMVYAPAEPELFLNEVRYPYSWNFFYPRNAACLPSLFNGQFSRHVARARAHAMNTSFHYTTYKPPRHGNTRRKPNVTRDQLEHFADVRSVLLEMDDPTLYQQNP